MAVREGLASYTRFFLRRGAPLEAFAAFPSSRHRAAPGGGCSLFFSSPALTTLCFCSTHLPKHRAGCLLGRAATPGVGRLQARSPRAPAAKPFVREVRKPPEKEVVLKLGRGQQHWPGRALLPAVDVLSVSRKQIL